MKNASPSPAQVSLSRRRFLKESTGWVAGAAALSELPFVLTSRAASEEPIRIGVIGCGGRGTGAVLDALGAATRVIYPSAGYHTETVADEAILKNMGFQVTALADLFADRLHSCREQLQKLKVDVPEAMCFTGFDAYQKLLAIPEINYVILATPPHFRPAQLKAAIEAGKNVFMEKPVAVDGPGVRLVMDAGKLAEQKKLGIVAGTQRRHQMDYLETIKRIHDGAIGEIHYARCYWNGGVIWVIERQAGWTDMEWQVRNWNYFTWLSGDHIVEQHVHNLDIMNWVLKAHPIKASGLGGRLARPNKNYGHIYDHFAVEYEYPGGIHMFSQCRQMSGCEGKVEEAVTASKGQSNCRDRIMGRDGSRWRYRGEQTNPYQQEHLDLIASIRTGQPLNEAQAVAESTLTAIMGRESAYSGQSITWDQALQSSLRLGPETYAFGDLPFPPVAIPGQHKFA